MLLMNGYLRKAQHDENNLNIEVTVEVISDFKVKKASVFNGFKRQTTKSTAWKPRGVLLSSPSAKMFQIIPENLGFPGFFYLIVLNLFFAIRIPSLQRGTIYSSLD